ncbi:MAG TPA: 50S ribosomal protein L32 [Mycobacteriales bacterium]|nr:50S ribosomal protein L32 [Mycobacteriales bacterium]
MEVPKGKKSRARTRGRRAQWKATTPQLVKCGNRSCGQLAVPHRICPHCGQYRGRSVTS